MASCSIRSLARDLWASVSRKKTQHSRADLAKCLSVVDLTCLGVANTLGTGIYVILGQVAREDAGPSVVLSFLTASVASFLAGLCYAELGSRFPRAGSAYIYAYATLGELAGFMVGWNLILELAVGGAVAAKAWIQYMDALTNNSFSQTLEENIGVVSLRGLDRTPDVPAFCVVLIATAALSISVKSLCVFHNFLTVVGFLVIVGLVLVGAFNMDIENWTRGPGFFPGGMTGMLTAAAIGTYAFIGYEVTASAAGEATRRSRSLPTAIGCAFIIGLFACFSTATSLTLLVPFSLFTDRAPLMHVYALRGISGMHYFVVIGAFTSLLSALYASLFGLSRLIHCLAADGLLFRSLEKVSSKTGTPWVSCLVSGAFSGALALVLEHKILVNILGIGTMLASIAVALAVLQLRYTSQTIIPLEQQGLLSREDTGLSTYLEYSNYAGIAKPVWPTRPSASNRSPLIEMRETAELLSSSWVETHGSINNPDEVDTTCFQDHDEVHGSDSNSPLCDKNCYHQRTKQMAVEYVNDMFVSSLTDCSDKPAPTERSAMVVAVVVACMLGCMILVAVFTMCKSNLVPSNAVWPEAIVGLSTVFVFALLIVTMRQPKHSPRLRHKVPCIPALPLGTMWIHVQLIITLSLDAWLRTVVWSFMGIVIYALYASRHSKEKSDDGDDREHVMSRNDSQ